MSRIGSKSFSHRWMVHPTSDIGKAKEQYRICQENQERGGECICTRENVNIVRVNGFAPPVFFHDHDYSKYAMLFEYFNRHNRSGCDCDSDCDLENQKCNIHREEIWQYGLDGSKEECKPFNV